MKLIQQLNAAHKRAAAKSITYENVKFKTSFAEIMDALAIDGLVESEWVIINTSEGWWCNDTRHKDGLLVETATHPYTGPTAVTFSGNSSALKRVQQIMERDAEYEGCLLYTSDAADE